MQKVYVFLFRISYLFLFISGLRARGKGFSDFVSAIYEMHPVSRIAFELLMRCHFIL